MIIINPSLFLYSPDATSSEYNLSLMMEIGKIGGSWGKMSIYLICHLALDQFP